MAGDGRYYNAEAIPIICRVLAGNGVTNIWVPSGGIMSTPSVSAAIRTRLDGVCEGGIVLTASHNPGGPGEDFGIKYNLAYGQPAGEDFTDDVCIFNVCCVCVRDTLYGGTIWSPLTPDGLVVCFVSFMNAVSALNLSRFWTM